MERTPRIPSLSYRPRAFYLRQAIREAATVSAAQAAGEQAVRDLEDLLSWVRRQGLIPPKDRPTVAERRDNPRWEQMG
jgi:succinylarginine dihydrolase